ncbi:MAG: hypothetical protein AM325_005820 [Candidatus Thorarchaeota archaeon SMTZ1-45]|nr:MAG: hypothetical protein AM325_07575 [Candidatus Thorarchaeota archaeon SMTZ1-45]
MLSAISLHIYRYRKYLVLTLVVSLIAIPIADVLVIQRDRNRSEMYGEAFWIYGFSVYTMNDTHLADSMAALGFPYNDTYHVLPDYLGGVAYEYPIFGFIFFAIATWLFPGAGGLQPLWLNFILVLVFNLNLVLLSILLKEKLQTKQWARMFFAGYFVYGLIMSAGGGKLEPLVDCLFFMSMVLWQENQHGKAMFTLGLSVQTKVYPAVLFPLYFIMNPVSSVWFIVSMFATVIPSFFGASFESLISHILNTSSYSEYIVNSMYPGLIWGTPNLSTDPISYYWWLPAAIPLVIYVPFMIFTIRQYLPAKTDLEGKSLWQKILELKYFYLYLLPGILFVFRWVMPWYLYWLAPLVILFDSDKRASGYLKEMVVVGFLYAFGLLCNWPYFSGDPGPLRDFVGHFPLRVGTFLGLILIGILAGMTYLLWKWEFDRRDRKIKLMKEAETRGELII